MWCVPHWSPCVLRRLLRLCCSHLARARDGCRPAYSNKLNNSSAVTLCALRQHGVLPAWRLALLIGWRRIQVCFVMTKKVFICTLYITSWYTDTLVLVVQIFTFQVALARAQLDKWCCPSDVQDKTNTVFFVEFFRATFLPALSGQLTKESPTCRARQASSLLSRNATGWPRW